LIFVMNTARVEDGNPSPLVVLDWSSKRLTRVSRSSLSSEAQAAANGVDALGWAKAVFALALDPTLVPNDPATFQYMGDSPCITDAKALYDAAMSTTSGGGLGSLAEKRTAIEILMVKEKMSELGGKWRWVNTEQQLADGLTKVSARQRFVEILRRAWHALRWDPEFTAGKKVTMKERMAREKELDDAAEDAADAFAADDVSGTIQHVSSKVVRRRTKYAKEVAATIAAMSVPGAAGDPMAPVSNQLATNVARSYIKNYDKNEMILALLLLFTLVTGIVLGILLATACGALGRKRRTRSYEEREVHVRDMMVQSQCTYTQHRTTPRFTVLHEAGQGAWPMALHLKCFKVKSE